MAVADQQEIRLCARSSETAGLPGRQHGGRKVDDIDAFAEIGADVVLASNLRDSTRKAPFDDDHSADGDQQSRDEKSAGENGGARKPPSIPERSLNEPPRREGE